MLKWRKPMPQPEQDPNGAGYDRPGDTSTATADVATWASVLLEPVTVGVIAAIAIIAGLLFHF
jgi:hypothetical protein